MLAPIINYLRVNKMPDIVFREITGNNIPHVAIVRNKDELIDQSICQFGNTAAFFGTGLVLDKVFEGVRKMVKTPLTPKNTQLYHFGKSLAIYSAISSILLAMPQFRNFVTTKRTHTTQYADMIGEDKSKTANQDSAGQKEAQLLASYRNKVLKTLGVGLGGALGLGALTLGAAKAQFKLPWLLRPVHRLIGLEKGQFKNFSPLSAVLFWVTPTFSGFLMGARDIYELKEIALRFAAFNFAFFVFPITIEKAIDRGVRKLKPTWLLGPSKNIAYMGKFFTSLALCSAIPTVVNIYLTRQRVARDKQKQNKAQCQPFNQQLQATLATDYWQNAYPQWPVHPSQGLA